LYSSLLCLKYSRISSQVYILIKWGQGHETTSLIPDFLWTHQS
jgi:hypothetical protein